MVVRILPPPVWALVRHGVAWVRDYVLSLLWQLEVF